ncbi:hypothetical protein [Phocaeicola paurosaccharolyticus]|jgi:hypothetical protein|uniref:hypothetical protein n=1 Tax=Phocaeicola paurosaccharolyticus TaxID=732242 RepID=UPI000469212A|nr:hypothetical protein [Phocaeicola paurosaccharolyticus]
MENIVIAGMMLQTRLMERSELKGVFTDALLGYTFYDVLFQGNEFVLLQSKDERKLAPLQYKKLAEQLASVLKKPCVFLFNSLATYERNRLIERGVFFVVSGKYVFLPFLLINAKDSVEISKDRMQPASQYLLLYHLQKEQIQNATLSDLSNKIPYNYLAISRAVRQLEAMQLVDVNTLDSGIKEISFSLPNQELWKKTEPLMQNPIKAIWYADDNINEATLGGIDALSAYSHLNPDYQRTVVFYDKDFNKIRDNTDLRLNKVEGLTRIEVWKYPPILYIGNIVDKLSLYLTLKYDHDPRVQKELETMIKSLW